VIIRNTPPTNGFIDVDVLNLTSVELRDGHSIRLAEFGLRDYIEVVAALTETAKTPFSRADLTRLLDDLELSLPCFLGWQGWEALSSVPFLTDGSQSKWSLFFGPEAQVTLVQRENERLSITRVEPFSSTTPPVRALFRQRLAAVRKRVWRSKPEPT
jgi:hypothetical protein